MRRGVPLEDFGSQAAATRLAEAGGTEPKLTRPPRRRLRFTEELRAKRQSEPYDLKKALRTERTLRRLLLKLKEENAQLRRELEAIKGGGP